MINVNQTNFIKNIPLKHTKIYIYFSAIFMLKGINKKESMQNY